MDGERWQRIDEIVQTAVELAPAERAAFLDAACAGDDDLRAHVARLLSYDERVFTLIERPAAELVVDMLTAAEPALSPGQHIGRYEVVDFVGAGGMGEVYRARDAELGRTVALKLLPPDFTTDDTRVRRFQAEARAASSLNHPNIITVYEIGRHEDAQFIATEFIEGETLRERLRRGQLTTREALEIAVQAAEALAAAHRAGIVHRDVKPENIMLRPDGYVKVLDFGLAKLTEQETLPVDAPTSGASATDSILGAVIGTVRYMSPEQARGERLDASSDVFSLGVVVYEMIAGRLPFDGETSDAVIAAILHREPVALGAYALSVPDELERIVARCLAKSAGERYRNAAELLSDLEALVRALDLGAAAPSRRRTTARAAAAVAGVLLLGASGYSTFRWLRPTPPEPFRTVTKTDVATGAAPAAAVISPDGKLLAELDTSPSGPDYALFVRDLSTGKRECVVSSDVTLIPPTFSPDSASVYYYMTGPRPATVFRLPLHGGEVQKVVDETWCEVDVSPDGSRLAFGRVGDAATELVVAGADGSDERVIATRLRPDGFFLNPAWSPDGRRLICRDASGLVEVSVEDGATTPVAKGPLEMIKRVRWHPSGRGLVVLGAPLGQDLNQLWYLTYPDGQAWNITNDEIYYDDFSATAEGSALLGIQRGSSTNLLVALQGDLYQVAQITNEPFNRFWIVVWTPDGRILAANTADGARDLWVMDADGTNRRRLTNGMNAEFPSASPDGRYVAFTSRRFRLNEIWRIDADGGNPTRLTEGRAPTCSPDGSVIFMRDSNLWKIPIEGGTPVQLAEGPYAGWPEVSPDGKLVVVHYSDDRAKPSRIAIVSAEDGRLVKVLDIEPHGPVHWTPDGRGVIFWSSAVLSQPLAGGPIRVEVDFPTNWNLMPMVAGYATSRDGTLVWVNSTGYSGTVLIKSVE